MVYDRQSKSSSWTPTPRKSSFFPPSHIQTKTETKKGSELVGNLPSKAQRDKIRRSLFGDIPEMTGAKAETAPTEAKDVENPTQVSEEATSGEIQAKAETGLSQSQGYGVPSREVRNKIRRRLFGNLEPTPVQKHEEEGTSPPTSILQGEGSQVEAGGEEKGLAETEISLPIQAKLTIGEPNDKYEQEADRVARQVVDKIHSPTPETVQREEMGDEDEVRLKSEAGSGGKQEAGVGVTGVRNSPIEGVRVNRKVNSEGETSEASAQLEASIQGKRGSGQPLDESVKEPMEREFGADFSGVRVHRDTQSDELNQAIQAKAFTTGEDIFFREGAYEPGSKGGQELLAHELTHVVQQSGEQLSTSTIFQQKLAPSQEVIQRVYIWVSNPKDGEMEQVSLEEREGWNRVSLEQASVSKILNWLSNLRNGSSTDAVSKFEALAKIESYILEEVRNKKSPFYCQIKKICDPLIKYAGDKQKKEEQSKKSSHSHESVEVSKPPSIDLDLKDLKLLSIYTPEFSELWIEIQTAINILASVQSGEGAVDIPQLMQSVSKTSIQNYKKQIRTSGVWGDHPEAIAIANYYKFKCNIFKADSKNKLYIATTIGNNKPKQLHLFHTGIHYMVLKPNAKIGDDAPNINDDENSHTLVFQNPQGDGDCLYASLLIIYTEKKIDQSQMNQKTAKEISNFREIAYKNVDKKQIELLLIAERNKTAHTDATPKTLTAIYENPSKTLQDYPPKKVVEDLRPIMEQAKVNQDKEVQDLKKEIIEKGKQYEKLYKEYKEYEEYEESLSEKEEERELTRDKYMKQIQQIDLLQVIYQLKSKLNSLLNPSADKQNKIYSLSDVMLEFTAFHAEEMKSSGKKVKWVTPKDFTNEKVKEKLKSVDLDLPRSGKAQSIYITQEVGAKMNVRIDVETYHKRDNDTTGLGKNWQRVKIQPAGGQQGGWLFYIPPENSIVYDPEILIQTIELVATLRPYNFKYRDQGKGEQYEMAARYLLVYPKELKEIPRPKPQNPDNDETTPKESFEDILKKEDASSKKEK